MSFPFSHTLQTTQCKKTPALSLSPELACTGRHPADQDSFLSIVQNNRAEGYYYITSTKISHLGVGGCTYKFEPKVNITGIVVVLFFFCKLHDRSFQKESQTALLTTLWVSLLCPFYVPEDKAKAVSFPQPYSKWIVNGVVKTFRTISPVPDVKSVISVIHTKL